MITLLSFIISGVVIFVDQLTKFLIYGNATQKVIGDFLWFQSTLNTGVAFSWFEGNSFIFIIITAIASILLIYLILSKKFFNKSRFKICFGLILGGTIGNLIDRIIFDGVRDFIYLKFINFAIFNVADAVIVVSVILFCVFYLIDTFSNKDNNATQCAKISSDKKEE